MFNSLKHFGGVQDKKFKKNVFCVFLFFLSDKSAPYILLGMVTCRVNIFFLSSPYIILKIISHGP